MGSAATGRLAWPIYCVSPYRGLPNLIIAATRTRSDDRNLESCARFLSACGRGFIFQTATNTQSPNPYRLGFFLPFPPVKTAMPSRASLRRRRDFWPDSLKFFSLLSIHPKSGESFFRTSSMIDAGKVSKLRNLQESFHFCSHVQHHLSGHDSLLLGPPDLPVQ